MDNVKKELTKTKLNKILKKYRGKLEQHNREWEEFCKKKHKVTDLGGDKIQVSGPNIYDHEKFNSKGAKLFKNIMEEFSEYEVFPKKVK